MGTNDQQPLSQVFISDFDVSPVAFEVDEDLDVEEERQTKGQGCRGKETKPVSIVRNVLLVLAQVGQLNVHVAALLVLDKVNLEEAGKVDDQGDDQDANDVESGFADLKVRVGATDAQVPLQRNGHAGVDGSCVREKPTQCCHFICMYVSTTECACYVCISSCSLHPGNEE